MGHRGDETDSDLEAGELAPSRRDPEDCVLVPLELWERIRGILEDAADQFEVDEIDQALSEMDDLTPEGD